MSEPHHEAAKAVLWCCHVRGSDDVYAAPDYETALKWAGLINAINFHVKPLPQSYEDCLLKAVPAPWPWSAESHAEDVPKSINDFAVPGSADEVGALK